MTKKIPESKILSLVILCGKCGKENHLPLASVYFSASESECELCGSHGSMDVDVVCSCGYKSTINIKDW